MRRSLICRLWAATLAAAAWADPSPEWTARTTLAQQLDIGESAPDWLVVSETYAIGYNPNEWDALAQSKVAFITHCPVNQEFFERCHALGIRCFPYVTFYQGFASQTYMGINLKDHSDFIEVDSEGNLTRTGFWVSEDAKNMYTTCPNVPGYQDAMVEWVRKIMELGADGVFVDNLSNRGPCYGPKFEKHQHLYDDQNQAFAMLLKRVRELIKQYKPEGAVLGNSASPTSLPKAYWKYLDAEMLESYICTWVSTERWFDWESHWHKAGLDLQPYVKAGKQIQALSYLGHTPYGVRDDAFYCYASARLAGFVWTGGGSIGDPDTAVLYRIRLGAPVTDERTENGAHYRVFERGLVAINPDKGQAATIALADPIPTRRFVDLYGAGVAEWDRYGTRGYSADHLEKRSGTRSIGCVNPAATDGSGAVQTLTLNQSEPKAITVSGWSKAQDVSGDSDGNYALYVDVIYNDGSPLYGQVAPFSVGTHDWEHKSVTIDPAKPVRSLSLYALFRNKSGRVWFDDIALWEQGGENRSGNGGFEEQDRSGRYIDASESGTLEIPAYSGRVYLFASTSNDQLSAPGPRLHVVTAPALGNVRFRVDGFDYWTHSGRWTTEYVLGPSFGTFDIVFDAPGKHTLELIDVVPSDMHTPQGYGGGVRLNEFMDPSNPTKPSEGKTFRFKQWTGRGTSPSVEIEIESDTTITAEFDITAPKAP